MLQFRMRPVSAIRCEQHKLLFDYESGTVALYDLIEEPQETHDLSAMQPALAEQMRVRLFAWLDQNQSLKPQLRE